MLLLRLQAPQLGVHVHQVDARRVVDIERRFHQLVQRVVQLAALFLVEIAGAETLAVHPRRGAQHAGEQRLLGHFKRKNGHRLFQLESHVLGDVQRQRGFAHRRAARPG